MTLWPFKPTVDYTETLEFKTDVLRTKSAEQRISLRDAPRRSFAFSFVFNQTQYAAARLLARYAESFLLPDWATPAPASGVTLGASVPITVDTSGWTVTAGDRVFLFNSATDFQQVEIESLEAYGFKALQVTQAQGMATAYPLLPALCPDGLKLSRNSQQIVFARATFHVTQNSNLAASSYAQYRGADLMTTVPILGGGRLDEEVVWPLDEIDNELGTQALVRQRSLPDEKFDLRWMTASVAELATLRQWLHSRRGRQIAFWVPTYNADLTLAATINPTDTTVALNKPYGVETLDRTAFDLVIKTATTWYVVQVLNAVNDTGNVVNMTLSAALGATITSADVLSIECLRCARFDADRIELRHMTKYHSAVTIPCIEVPVP